MSKDYFESDEYGSCGQRGDGTSLHSQPNLPGLCMCKQFLASVQCSSPEERCVWLVWGGEVRWEVLHWKCPPVSILAQRYLSMGSRDYTEESTGQEIIFVAKSLEDIQMPLKVTVFDFWSLFFLFLNLEFPWLGKCHSHLPHHLGKMLNAQLSSEVT